MRSLKNKWRIVLIGAGVVGSATFLYFDSEGLRSTKNVATGVSNTSPKDVFATSQSVDSPEAIAARRIATDPRWNERKANLAKDRNFEWKLPLNFWGRVVDQDEQPVPGVEARFQWSDLSPDGARVCL